MTDKPSAEVVSIPSSDKVNAEAAAKARNNAEAAATAAIAAKENAEAQVKVIEGSKNTVDGYASLSQTAKNNADASAKAAETAKENAEIYSKASLKAKETAEATVLPAETAKNNAENYATAAQTAKNNAEAAAKAAEDAKGNSETAKSSILAALTEATNSKQGSEEAEEAALAAKENAETSANEAATAKSNVDEIAKAAEAAKTSIEEYLKTAIQQLDQVTAAKEKAETEAKNAAEAHHMSTTVGLAGAFNEKARAATIKQGLWAVGLGIALLALGRLGWLRFDTIAELIKALVAQNQPLSALGTDIMLSFLTIAAPVWFAWFSARMISRYFHLAEDYSYKAALAKAYMGFKEQAKDLDPIFQERLFAAAITQLDCNPMRFDDDSHPVSPLQDLLQQSFMHEALKNKGFKSSFLEWMNKIFKKNSYTRNIELSIKDDLPESQTAGE